MIKIDDRITKDHKGIFQKLVGKKLINILHDPFLYTNSVYGIVGMNIEETYYAVTNKIEVRDYYGKNEDVAVFKIKKVENKTIHSLVEGVTMITTPINQKIMHVDVVNENQRLSENEEQIYDVWITRGFIIELEDGLQVSFEKEVWFSEDINIEKGYNLIDRFFPTKRIVAAWSNPKKMICERQIIKF